MTIDYLNFFPELSDTKTITRNVSMYKYLVNNLFVDATEVQIYGFKRCYTVYMVVVRCVTPSTWWLLEVLHCLQWLLLRVFQDSVSTWWLLEVLHCLHGGC